MAQEEGKGRLTLGRDEKRWKEKRGRGEKG